MADGIDFLLEGVESVESLAGQAIRDRLVAASDSGRIRESWKYTKLQKFLPESITRSQPRLEATAETAVSRLSEQRTDQSGESALQYLGDRVSANLYPLADLALLIAGDCLLIDVPTGTSSAVSLTFVEGFNLPVHIRVGQNSRLELLENTESASFSNHSLYLDIADGAEVVHARHAFDQTCSDWALTQVVVGTHGRYQLYQYLNGGRQRRSESQIILNGPGASASMLGAYRVDTGTHLDQQLTVEHRAGSTTSTQQFHGLAAGKGTAVFNGRIHIHPGAPGSDAQLSNRNLALHPDAIINTKPELEIYTDDVKCAHGATIGQISEDSLFYLRSRGVDTEIARQMLCRAFIRECISGPQAEIADSGLLDDVYSSEISNS
jgi:Fe-S cluster assembly protein SufD